MPGADVGEIFHDQLAKAGGVGFVDLNPENRGLWTLAIVERHAAATVAWDPVVLDLERFAACLGRAAAPLTMPFAPRWPSVSQIFDRLHTSDVYLACAAGCGVAGAAELFVSRFLGPIEAAVQSIDRDPALIDDVRQALHERLLLPNDGAEPRIFQYGGRASLATWIGVAAQREALGILRAEGARDRADVRASEEPSLPEFDPELAYLKDLYRDAFKAALSLGIARLSARQRALLRLHSVGGFTLQRIARMMNVDESTVSRWMHKAREAILEETKRELGQRLGIHVAEVPSIARLVTSQLDLSVNRLLLEESVAGEIKAP